MGELDTLIDTSWARKSWVRAIRAVLIECITLPGIKLLARPTVIGADRLENVEGPVIFVANHSSHLDTSVIYAALPPRFRHKVAVTAGADLQYFFGASWKIAIWGVWMNILPIDRHKVSRSSIRVAQAVAKDGWSLVIYPEGTRGEDDFAIPFKPGAAYLAIKSGLPVVPIHIEGTRRVFTPYTKQISPGPTRVVIGNVLRANPDEKPQRFNERIENAVATCADEGRTDWWSARLRLARGQIPSLQAPASLQTEGSSGWRKGWAASKRVQSLKNNMWPL